MKSQTFTRGAALGCALLLAHASTALAAGGESTPLHLPGSGLPTHAAGSSSGSDIVRTIVGLFIVIAVIYGVTWLLRQVKGKGKGKRSGSTQGLTQLANLPLGNGRAVALVRAGQEIVLLGLAEHSVTKIRTYTEAEAIELGIDVVESASAGSGGGFAARRSGTQLGRVLDGLRRMTVRS